MMSKIKVKKNINSCNKIIYMNINDIIVIINYYDWILLVMHLLSPYPENPIHQKQQCCPM